MGKDHTDPFKLYPRTSTINYFIAIGICSVRRVPFQIYLDLEKEMVRSTQVLRYMKLPLFLWKFLSLRSISLSMFDLEFIKPESTRKVGIDWFLYRRFRKESKAAFMSCRNTPLFQNKRRVIHDLEKAYEKSYGEPVFRLFYLCLIT